MGKRTFSATTLDDIQTLREDFEKIEEIFIRKFRRYSQSKDMTVDYKKILVIEEGDRLVGFFSLSNRQEGMILNGVAVLTLAYLSREYRGKGCFKRIIEEIERFARSKGYRYIVAFVAPEVMIEFISAGFRSRISGWNGENVLAGTLIPGLFLSLRRSLREANLTSMLEPSTGNIFESIVGQRELRMELNKPDEFRREFFHSVWSNISKHAGNSILDNNVPQFLLYRIAAEVIEDNLLMAKLKGKDILLAKCIDV